MRVLKRDGTYQTLSFDKVLNRIKNISNGLSIDIDSISQQVISFMFDGVSSSELDEETSKIAINLSHNTDYTILANRIIISNLHKSTEKYSKFSDIVNFFNENVPELLNKTFVENVNRNAIAIEEAIDYTRDYNFDYFGYKTLEKGFLIKVKDVMERPQHMYMRVAVTLHENDIENIIKTYNLLSTHYYIHSSPTMFNAGLDTGCNSSCFLLGTDDSLEGIFKTFTDCGKISKTGGGIGVHISNIRATGSVIKKTNGKSDGIVPMLKVYSEISKYINQSGRRPGSFAMYLEPWHADILGFLSMKRVQTEESKRARALMYALWIPDLFMKAVESDSDWYLMSPDTCPGLTDVYGDEFEELYNRYVKEGKYTSIIKARTIWISILESHIETGVPYMGYKDAVNKKCNQKNLGTIKSSNLCMEISLYSDADNYAVCNLCSISLPKFVKFDENNSPYFDFEELHGVAYYTVVSMNRVIDTNRYPMEEASRTDYANRPLGIGIQGLVDVYFKMNMAYESDTAKKLNKEIFECFYHGVLSSSIDQAKIHGPYSNFAGSPFSQGKFQFDLAQEYDNIDLSNYLSNRYDWDDLRSQVKMHGIRNSMLTALMPTATSAQIMNNTESFELVTSCLFKRTVKSGEYMVLNKYLVEQLEKIGLWSNNIREKIIIANGSIQNIPEIPREIKDIFKTAWEVSMKHVIDQASDRGVFIDQMQSMNLHIANPTFNQLSSMHMYAWKAGLKTGMYYLRSKSVATPAKFSVDVALIKEHNESSKDEQTSTNEDNAFCSIDNKEDCIMCSS